ncbi:hypothetical protein CTheo_8531 [Ceratobasidium theobromae]|uniref:Uncharacterized protein n=1 Tax=Ceratobasidium theobromae TaxID=1582974 RepID=A0A5N5Q8R3_9AGAM|nr:hypothetical protein CTheo_8531 [Ceratobasidium theobromae]
MILPADREVSIAPADPTTFIIAPPMALPGTEHPMPAPQSPLPVKADDPELMKKVADLILDITTKDMLDRLTTPVVLDPPGNERLAMPQILGGPWDWLRITMWQCAACPYAKAGESSLTRVKLRLWGELLSQVSGFANEVSNFMESFNNSPHRIPDEATASTPGPTPQNQFVWSGDDVALAMQAAVFTTSREFISWDRTLQCTHNFNMAHKAHAMPPENNALGLSIQPPMEQLSFQPLITESAAKPTETEAAPMPAP